MEAIILFACMFVGTVIGRPIARGVQLMLDNRSSKKGVRA